jgi:hypothetical protein
MAGSGLNDWIVHHSQYGFTVGHPPGWTVEVDDGDKILVHDGRRISLVLIHPFRLQVETTAEQWLREAVGRFARWFRNSNLERVSQCSASPDEAVAELSYYPLSHAAMLCSIADRSGMCFAIAAPTPTFSFVRHTLMMILQSFVFTESTAVAATAATPQQELDLKFVRWRDPNQGAFTVEVPERWLASGGMVTAGQSDYRGEIQVTAPDRSIVVKIGDTRIPTYSVPTPMMAMAGINEGSWHCPGGTNMLVSSFVSGLDFAKNYITNFMQCRNVQYLEASERPDWAEAAYKRNYIQAPGAQTTCSAGHVSFSCGDPPHTMCGYCIACTVQHHFFELANWNVECLGHFVAAPQFVSTAMAVLSHMFATYTEDVNWLRQTSNQAAMDASILSATSAATRNAISESYWHRRQVEDNLRRQWSNTTLGLVDVVDPLSHETWKVAAGKNYYWRGGNTIVGTDLYDRPNINFEPLLQV